MRVVGFAFVAILAGIVIGALYAYGIERGLD